MDEQELIEELRSSLRHVPAPRGFTESVLQRVAERDRVRHRGTTTRQKAAAMVSGTPHRAAWWTAAAAALAIAVGGGDLMRLHHQRALQQTRAAEAQVDLALQLTSHALYEVEIGLDRSPAGRYTQLVDGVQR